MPVVTVDADPSLRPLLAPARRAGPVPVHAAPTDTLGHIVESVGIPLPEVGGLRLDGVPVEPAARASPGTLGVAPVVRPQGAPTDPPRFLLDVHLARLARHLWLLGLDAVWLPDAADRDLAQRSADEHRVLLTCDRMLLHRRTLAAGALVRGELVDDQLTDVLDRFAPLLDPWTRCMACGARLRSVPAAQVADRVPPATRRTVRDFARCPSCARVFWRGAHARRLDAVVDAARRTVERRRPSVP